MRAILALLLLFTGLLAAESVAGVKWTAPAGWKPQAERPMRAATYAVAATDGDKDNAECVVYFFGPGQGGSVEANIDRWKGQFQTADGKPATAKTGKRTIHGFSVTTVEADGTYSGMGGPMGGGDLKQGYRMLGAIVENPDGNLFVKFTGPAKTIVRNLSQYEQLLASFTKL